MGLLSFDFAQPVSVAYNESGRRVVALHKVGQVERLTEDEEPTVEGVAHLEFRILCRLDGDCNSLLQSDPMASRGFNQLVKVKRQGRWFLLKGLKPEFRKLQVYLELLKKEF